jgi:site-specific recombinase XerD
MVHGLLPNGNSDAPSAPLSADPGVLFSDAARQYMRSCEDAENTEDTLRGKQDSIEYFYEYLLERKILHVQDISTEVCREYLRMRRDKGNAPATRLHHHRILKAAFKWIGAEYGLPNPWDRVSAPTIPPGAEKPTVPNDIVSQLLAQCDPDQCNGQLEKFRALRDAAMLQLLRCTPARIGDFEKLRIEDVDLDNSKVYVITKGRKADVRQWNKPECTRALAAYIEARKSIARGDHLWVDARYKKSLGMKMTRGWTRRMLARMSKVVGFHVHPHMFRHTFATNAAKSGMPLPLLETLGSWTKGSMALRKLYLSTLNPEDGRQALIDYDPVPDLPDQARKPGRPRKKFLE